MRKIRLIKSYKDDMCRNIFIAKCKDSVYNCYKDLSHDIVNAENKVCLVLESGMNDKIAEILYNIKARTYVIVPSINESKYTKLKASIIAREVDNIKGNYAIIDGNIMYIFDENLNGYCIKNTSIDVVQQLFLKEFWENGQEEFIYSKVPCADVTFDIPPIYGDSNVLIDESFDSKTAVDEVLSDCALYAFTGKVKEVSDGQKIIIKDSKSNSDYLTTTNNENILLAPYLPISMVVDNKTGSQYLFNFDIAKYNELPEKGKGRLFAVKASDVNMGAIYKFYKHKTFDELVDKDVLDINGNVIQVLNSIEESRNIDADMRMSREYSKMDSETLEAILEKKNPSLLNTDVKACTIGFEITIEDKKKTMNKKAHVYDEYANANNTLKAKYLELEEFIKKHGIKCKEFDKYEVAEVKTIDAYNNIITELNNIIDVINNHDALSEVMTSKKKGKVVISKINPIKISMNYPTNGLLYENSGKYEYVLTSEDKLDFAIQEMDNNGINKNNILYIKE